MRRLSSSDALLGLLGVALFLFFVFSGAGCAHLPRIIVLEDPLSADEHVALGVTYERNGELALAAREYERALSKDKGAYQARVNLGNVRLAERRYDEARDAYLAALKVRPGDPDATNNLCWAAIFSGGGREDALRRMEEAMSVSAQRLPPYLDTLGVLLGELSRAAEADDVLREAEQRCAQQAPACTEAVLRELAEHREALRTRRESAAVAPPRLR